MFRHISRPFSLAMQVKNDSIPSRFSDRFFLGKRWATGLFLASALLAPQVCFADVLDKYINAGSDSVWSKVGGRTLFQVPKVRDSMRKLLGRERLKFVRDELNRVGDFEELQDPELGRVLYVLLFLQHNAPVQASLFIRSDGETIAACTSDAGDDGFWTVWSGPDWQIKTKVDESGDRIVNECGSDADDAVKRLKAAKTSAKGEHQPAQQ